MKTIEIKLYKFDELAPKAKEKAIKDFIKSSLLLDNEHEIEYHTEQLEEKGILDAKIVYEGFYSQGDGASFTGTIDLQKFMDTFNLTERYQEIYNSEIDVRVVRYNSNYCHEKSMFVFIESHYNVDTDDFAKEVLYIVRDLAKDIYKSLKAEYEYQTSEEAVTETIQANDYDFFENGEFYYEYKWRLL